MATDNASKSVELVSARGPVPANKLVAGDGAGAEAEFRTFVLSSIVTTMSTHPEFAVRSGHGPVSQTMRRELPQSTVQGMRKIAFGLL